MINKKKIIVILPAYNAEKTLEKTFSEIPFDIVDDIILTDDFSSDHTVSIAKKLGIQHIIEHKDNLGYGANQKSCYQKALELDADIIVMLHPDYQYDPKLIPTMCSLIASGVFKVVLGSRILGKSALKGGMPIYKYLSNRALTFIQNLLMGQKLSEYHTGYRCFHAELLKNIPFQANSDDFIFDNQVLAQILLFKDGFATKQEHEKKLYVKVLPKKLDEEVASLMVKGFGGTITKLTKQQQEYISVKEGGPFKDEHYTY